MTNGETNMNGAVTDASSYKGMQLDDQITRILQAKVAQTLAHSRLGTALPMGGRLPGNYQFPRSGALQCLINLR